MIIHIPYGPCVSFRKTCVIYCNFIRWLYEIFITRFYVPAVVVVVVSHFIHDYNIIRSVLNIKYNRYRYNTSMTLTSSHAQSCI